MSIVYDSAAGVQDVLTWAGLSQPVTLSLPQDLYHLCPRVSPLMARRLVAAYCSDHVSLTVEAARVLMLACFLLCWAL